MAMDEREQAGQDAGTPPSEERNTPAAERARVQAREGTEGQRIVHGSEEVRSVVGWLAADGNQVITGVVSGVVGAGVTKVAGKLHRKPASPAAQADPPSAAAAAEPAPQPKPDGGDVPNGWTRPG